MITRTQKVRLGIFVVGSLALLVVTVGVLAGLQLAETRDEYTMRLTTSVSGLEVGAPVKYHGVRVGRVDAVRIDRKDPSQVLIAMSLDEGTPVKTDTTAVVNTAGITGLRFVELTGGTAESEFVAPGSEIRSDASLLDRLSGQAEVIAEKVELLVNNLTDLTNETNRARIGRLLEDADTLVLSAQQVVDENRDNVRAIASSLRETADSLAATIDRLDGEAAAALGAIREAATSLQGLVDPAQVAAVLTQAERLIATARQKLKDVDVAGLVGIVKRTAERAEDAVKNIDLTVLKSREDLFGSLNYLLEGLENFSEFARIIRENPSLLLRGPEEEERDLP